MSNHIAKARAGLIIDQPFFASLLLPMPIKEDNSIPTFATDGDQIWYNKEWAESLSLKETTFVLAHEVLHCVFDHMGRRENRTPNRWNQAADYIINDILIKERIGTMPDGGLHNPGLVTKGNGMAEGVYKLLPESSEKKGPGQAGGAMDSVLDAGSDMGKNAVDAATKAAKSAEMKVRVTQAKNVAKMAGTMPGSLERLIDDLLKPYIDWKSVLRRFISERAKIDYSYARPKRRFLAEDFYLPSQVGERMGVLSVAVDCSGSVDRKLLTKFAAEINAIKQDVHPSRIEVVYFDAEVLKTEIFEADDEISLTPVGGGGTMFSPVFKHINAQSELPICCVFLTDLYCSDFGKPPPYPVLWCVLEGDFQMEVPFGEILTIEDNDNDEKA